MTDKDNGDSLPLEGIRVIDAATLFAGPVIATLLGDYGADVVKVEPVRCREAGCVSPEDQAARPSLEVG